ncbi:MAG: hypothetical protein JO023_14345 [Chloroflexi bacterium]|nr:hypothetical protein [Chloroflexota bacterium]
MSIASAYARLGAAARLSQARANQIVEQARLRALLALGRVGEPPAVLDVQAALVEPAANRGGSLVPAWPHRTADNSVRIDFVADWGGMLAAWRSGLDGAEAELAEIDELLASGERLEVGIANDVLQLFVQDPPAGSYSMVRHHGLMLAAATTWLGPERTRAWRRAHTRAAACFLGRSGNRPVWDAVGAAESGLDVLLGAPEAHGTAAETVAWLERDDTARAAYVDYLGAASLGVAALLDEYADEPADVWVPRLVAVDHPQPDFNRAPIERLVARL